MLIKKINDNMETVKEIRCLIGKRKVSKISCRCPTYNQSMFYETQIMSRNIFGEKHSCKATSKHSFHEISNDLCIKVRYDIKAKIKYKL